MQPALQIGPFDYDSLPPEHQPLLKAIVSDIAENATLVIKSVERIGQRLIDAKALVPGGQWLNWLHSINLSHSTASNYMNVATHWGGSEIVEMTDLAPLFVVSTSRVADEVRADFATLVKRGELLDEDASKALRDAPPTLRARYVMGTISKQQFVGLAAAYKKTPADSRGQPIRHLIDQQLTDPEAASRLSKLDADTIEIAVNTGYVNFDAKPVPVEKLTSELMDMHRWQTQPPQEDDADSGDSDPNPPLLKARGRVESVAGNHLAIVLEVDADEVLQPGLTYTFTVR